MEEDSESAVTQVSEVNGVCNSLTRLCCVCRRREARPRRFHLLQRSGWKSRGDRGRLEHDARLLRCHSYRKFYV